MIHKKSRCTYVQRLFFLWCVSLPLFVQANEERLPVHCEAEIQDTQRLDCFDVWLAEQQAKEELFPSVSEPEPGVYRVMELRSDAYGKLKVLLDSGIWWKQVDSSALRLKVGDELKIQAAAADSFLAHKLPKSRKIRVRPIHAIKK